MAEGGRAAGGHHQPLQDALRTERGNARAHYLANLDRREQPMHVTGANCGLGQPLDLWPVQPDVEILEIYFNGSDFLGSRVQLSTA